MSFLFAELDINGKILNINDALMLQAGASRKDVIGASLMPCLDSGKRAFIERTISNDTYYHDFFFNEKETAIQKDEKSCWVNTLKFSNERKIQNIFAVGAKPTSPALSNDFQSVVTLAQLLRVKHVIYRNPSCMFMSDTRYGSFNALLRQLNIKVIQSDNMNYAIAFRVDESDGDSTRCGQKFIVYGKHMTTLAKRMSVFHECAHHLLNHTRVGFQDFWFPKHMVDSGSINPREYKEQEAEILAYQMMVPSHKLLKLAVTGNFSTNSVMKLLPGWSIMKLSEEERETFRGIAEKRICMFKKNMQVCLMADEAGIIDMGSQRPWMSAYKEMVKNNEKTQYFH